MSLARWKGRVATPRASRRPDISRTALGGAAAYLFAHQALFIGYVAIGGRHGVLCPAVVKERIIPKRPGTCQPPPCPTPSEASARQGPTISVKQDSLDDKLTRIERVIAEVSNNPTKNPPRNCDLISSASHPALYSANQISLKLERPPITGIVMRPCKTGHSGNA